MSIDTRMDRRNFLRLAAVAAGTGYVSRGGVPTARAASPAQPLPWQPGAAKVADGRLLFYGQPFAVRGVVYQPTPVGQDPTVNSGVFTAYSDPRIRQRDFPRLKRMNANVIRIYQPREILPEFFRDSLRYGLYVVLGFEVDTRLDLTAGWARNEVLQDFRRFVHTWRGQPSILMWALGNGVNGELRRTGREGHLNAWHTLADAMAKVAHEEEGGMGRPVVLVSSEAADIGVPAVGSTDSALPNVDLWGINTYRGRSFGSMFDDLKTAKPVLITEYGLDVRRQGASAELDPLPRAHATVNLWNEIGARPDKAVGGCLFEYSDEWWRVQPGHPDWHEWGGGRSEADPDGIANLEWYGLYGVAPSPSGLDLLSERRVVHYLSSAWAPLVTIGQPAVWFDVPLERDPVGARQRVSGRYSGLQPGWEIFVSVTPAGTGVPLMQPESCTVRAPSGSWVVTANLGPKQPSPGLELELTTLVAKTPAATAALREAVHTGMASLPQAEIIGNQPSIHVRRH